MSFAEWAFVNDKKWFRLRACGVLLDQDSVLMVRNKRSPYYYSVGGCVRHGESLQDAAKREVLEETGFNLEIERLLFIHENFFVGRSADPLNGMNCHELAFYFLFNWPQGTVTKAQSKTEDGIPEHLEWLKITQLNNLAFPVYPSFFSHELINLPASVRHVITFESA